MTFETWYTELISDERWYEYVTMRTKGKNFKAAAEFVYGQLVSDPILERRPMTENRKHVYNKLVTMAYDKVAPSLQQEVVSAENAQTEPPLTGEARQKKLAEVKAIFDSLRTVNAYPPMTKQQILEEGQWLPKKMEFTPRSDVEKITIIKQSNNLMRECRRKVFLDAYPDATEEEIRAYWNKFEDTSDEAL